MTYRVYLVDYPSRQDFGVFTVQFTLADFCDERLIDNFILPVLEPSCIPIDDEQEPEGPTEEELEEEEQLNSEFMPRWLRLVTD